MNLFLRYILPVILLLASAPGLKGATTAKLCIDFTDGSSTTLTLSGEIIMRPSIDNVRLEVSAPLGIFEFPLDAITEFKVEGAGSPISGNGITTADDADMPWEIYTLSGMRVAAGHGPVETDRLSPANTYLLRQSGRTLKFRTR